MSDATPRRRGFRFSLRALFAVLTVLGVFAGWLVSEYRVVRERAMAIRQIERDGGSVCFATQQPLFGRSVLSLDGSNMRIPRVRQLIGDKAYSCVILPPTYRRENARLSYLQGLLPEAEFSFVGRFPHFH